MKTYVCAILGVMLALGGFQHMAWSADAGQTLQDLSRAFTEIAEEVGQTVVAIETAKSGRDRERGRRFERRRGPEGLERLPEDLRRGLDDLHRRFRRNGDRDEDRDNFHRFFEAPGPRRELRIPEGALMRRQPDYLGFGSGIPIDNQGRIVTPAALVEGRRNITVTLGNGVRLDASVVGVDAETGVAVIEVRRDGLTIPKIGDSSQVMPGQLMLAVGHTEAQETAVAFGVISGVGRYLPTPAYTDWIALDANLRHVANGSAVVNTHGEIIGMTVFSSDGRPYAIPINTVKQIAARLIEDGTVARGWLGITFQEVDADLAEALGLDRAMGALITGILDDTPADQAGLMRGDVITAMAGQPIRNGTHLRHVVAMQRPGAAVTVTVMREDQKHEISVTLGERSEEAVRHLSRPEISKDGDWRGLSLQNLTTELAEEFETYTPGQGVLITHVAPGSPAAKAGEGNQKLRTGDLILEVEHQPIQDVGAFKSSVKELEGKALLQVKRGDRVWFIVVN